MALWRDGVVGWGEGGEGGRGEWGIGDVFDRYQTGIIERRAR